MHYHRSTPTPTYDDDYNTPTPKTTYNSDLDYGHHQSSASDPSNTNSSLEISFHDIMISRKVDAVGSILCILSSASLAAYGGCHALQILPPIRYCSVATYHTHHRLSSLSDNSNSIISELDDERPIDDDDETLLNSIDPSTLQNLCAQYSLSTSGTKQEMLNRLREFANQQAEMDAQRRRGRTQRVEANLEGKARHTVLDPQGEEMLVQELEDGYDEMQGYFYYASAETEEEKIRKEEERRKQKLAAMRKSQSHITAPNLPDNIQPNEKGERVVTVYSTTDRNDLTGMTSQSPVADNMSMDSARFQQKSLRDDQPEESLIGGPFGDTSGSKRKKADASQIENAKEYIREFVRNLLATTGAPAFQDDYDEEVESSTSRSTNSFSSPYGFTGFQPERIPPDVLSKSSAALRVSNGKALKDVLSEYELQAIGHDGMAADDKSKGGGHYREVENVGTFLEGYRKAEVRRIARETSAMLLDRLVKEGVKGLDQLLAGMVREGDDLGDFKSTSEGGELNGALVRYLEDAIRVQEQRVKKTPSVSDSSGNRRGTPDESDETELMWNVTRGEDGTIIETFDPNTPMVKKLLREELEKTKDSAGVMADRLLTMTVQEKMLLLLKLLRDRVKVEAVIGNDAHARNLRVLAYCLKAANDEERRQLIMEELGNSLDSLDVFSELVTASIDYADARTNDYFMPGDSQQAYVSPVLDVAKLQKIKSIVERIKMKASWKASGLSQ
ncbi:hypothetical protein ACHAWU_004958 [Discostella pseudostelligera]|uniref:SAP domain-containing protein n=1 Tax=Discostella pseudostelligera TaxID=259834 RepID=A0ABD3N9D7_9STRA